jgi:hypothetical protein
MQATLTQAQSRQRRSNQKAQLRSTEHAAAPSAECSAAGAAGSSGQSTKGKRILSAAGSEVEIPPIHGDGVNEIREMRGEILRAVITKALEGSYLHMRTLFEYAGLWPAASTAQPQSHDGSLAALLLEKLEGKPEAAEDGKALSTPAANEASSL